MSNQDHRHRNIAAIAEYLSEADVHIYNVDTPNDWDEHVAHFDIAVPSFDPHEIRDSDPIREAFVAGFMASAEGGNGEMAPAGTTPQKLAGQKYDEWRGDADD